MHANPFPDRPPPNISTQPAVWIPILIVLVLVLDIFAVDIYCEAESLFASIEIITIVGLLILSAVIILGGDPNQQS